MRGRALTSLVQISTRIRLCELSSLQKFLFQFPEQNRKFSRNLDIQRQLSEPDFPLKNP